MDKSDNKDLKRKKEGDDDDDDDVCKPVKIRKTIIESDDDDNSQRDGSKGTDEVESDHIAFASLPKDEDVKNSIPLRKTAPRRKTMEKEKDNFQSIKAEASNAFDSKAIKHEPDSPTKSLVDKHPMIKSPKKEAETSNKGCNLEEGKSTMHSFFAPLKSNVKKNDVGSADKAVSNSSERNGSSYNPALEDYDPLQSACWTKGQKVPYIALAKTFEEIEKVSARLKSIEILSNFLSSVIVLSPDDLVSCVYLCLNKLAPAYEGIELGIGENLLMKVVSQATGRSMEQIKSDVEKKGDIGIVAETCRSTQRTMFATGRLTVASVFVNLKEVALISGRSSMTKKTDKIKSMFVLCQGPEAKYLVRSLNGKLRIGMAELSVLQSIAQAFVVVQNSEKKLSKESLKKKVDEAALIIKTSYCECPNYDKILPLLLQHPLSELSLHCKITPGIPLKPMLAHPTKGIHEVLAKFEKSEFVCEYKYDGERAQIHLLENGKVLIFSRNQENNTSKYPDVASRVAGSANAEGKVTSAIIDAEVVAWDSANKHILPFQVLSTRKRKDADSQDIKVQVCIYAFDLLYLNGESLVRSPLRRRRDLLHEMFAEVEGEFMFAKSMVSGNTEDIAEFLEESIKGSCEGLMVKTLDEEATYEIAKRSHNWLKLKKDYLEGIGDTVDLVVVGGFHGTGKRTGKFGGFLLACYNPENEEYQTICKIGTGFTDADLDTHFDFLKNHIIDKPKNYYRFDSSHCPDKWFDAVQVWEVKAADLSLSPVHKAAIGLVDAEKGISLRFPRFLRIREDKKPEEATSSNQLATMYMSQDQIAGQTKNKSDDEDMY